MRYHGQRHALRISLATDSDIADIRRRFADAYQHRYGHADPDGPLEFVNLLLTMTAPTPRPDLARLAALATTTPDPAGTRDVDFGDGPLPATIWRRRDLPAGFTTSGPALIEEYGSTTLIFPTDRVIVGTIGELRIDINVA